MRNPQIAGKVRRGIERQEFLTRGAALVVGGSTALAMFFKSPTEAYASNCSYYGQYNGFGCFCASTPSCPGGCPNGNCGSLRKRCTYWAQPNSEGNYCWCSQPCYQGSSQVKYVCCDCWTGGSGGCSSGLESQKCVCKKGYTL